MTALVLGLVVPYEHWKSTDNHIWFVVVYGFTFVFANFGPSATKFIACPAEIYPARLRATCHRISAASGKVGAIIGSFGFLSLAPSPDPAETTHGYLSGIRVQNSLFALDACSFARFLHAHLPRVGARGEIARGNVARDRARPAVDPAARGQRLGFF
jgi:MFS transporter, PHS family, inorganic phosphate transporter